jgi:hypothetical protein
LTAQPNARVRFRPAIERRALWLAEDGARELSSLSLDEAFQLVELYAECESPKYERAARRWLERHIAEAEPSLVQLAEVTNALAGRLDLGAVPAARIGPH